MEAVSRKDIRNTKEIAEYLKISPRSIARLVHRIDNPIPHIRVSARVYRFDVDKVDEWLEDQEIR